MDNLSFSAPFFPIAVNFLPGAGSLANLFQPNPSTGFTGIPPLGVLSPTFVPQAALFNGFVPPSCTLGNGNASTNPEQCGPTFTGNVSSFIGLQVPLHWIAATTQQWNFTVQHEVGRNWFLEIGYVGTKGTHLRSTFDPDQATLATPQNPVTIPGVSCAGVRASGNSCQIVDTTAENANARAPFLGLAPSAFESFSPNSDSHYHSLQATVSHRFSGGLYWQSAYTFSKAIDDVSTATVAFDTRFNDQNNPRDSRGLSDFDRRQRFVTSAVYQLPFFSMQAALPAGRWAVGKSAACSRCNQVCHSRLSIRLVEALTLSAVRTSRPRPSPPGPVVPALPHQVASSHGSATGRTPRPTCRMR